MLEKKRKLRDPLDIGEKVLAWWRGLEKRMHLVDSIKAQQKTEHTLAETEFLQ